MSYCSVKKNIQNKAIQMLSETGQFEKVADNKVTSISKSFPLLKKVNNEINQLLGLGREIPKKSGRGTGSIHETVLNAEEPTYNTLGSVDGFYSEDYKSESGYIRGLSSKRESFVG